MSLISEEEMNQLRETFDYIDKNKDGFLNADELKVFMKSLGKEPSDKELKKMLKKSAKNGLMDFPTFVKITSCRVQDPEQEMMQAFRVFDKDGNGYITAQELKIAMQEMGMPLSDAEIQMMIREKDVNGDGVIDYEEFVAQNPAKI